MLQRRGATGNGLKKKVLLGSLNNSDVYARFCPNRGTRREFTIRQDRSLKPLVNTELGGIEFVSPFSYVTIKLGDQQQGRQIRVFAKTCFAAEEYTIEPFDGVSMELITQTVEVVAQAMLENTVIPENEEALRLQNSRLPWYERQAMNQILFIRSELDHSLNPHQSS